MKSIEQIIKNFLIEVRTQQKNEFNRGMEHRIYSSRNNPNRLFKVGDEGVLHWVKVFRSNPNIFLIVGDLGFSVVEKFAEEFPDRFLIQQMQILSHHHFSKLP